MSDRNASTSNNDAIWVVESTDFVTPYTPLKGSMFDDADRLHAAWRLTMTSLERDASSNGGDADGRTAETRPDDQATPSIIASLERHRHDIAQEQADRSATPTPTPTPEPGEETSGSTHLVRSILAWVLRRPRVDPARFP